MPCVHQRLFLAHGMQWHADLGHAVCFRAIERGDLVSRGAWWSLAHVNLHKVVDIKEGDVVGDGVGLLLLVLLVVDHEVSLTMRRGVHRGNHLVPRQDGNIRGWGFLQAGHQYQSVEVTIYVVKQRDKYHHSCF